jgi:uncharacterized protein YcfJ
MEPDNKPSKIHPLLATAAVAIVLVCLTGIAAMLGILPSFNKGTAPPVPENAIPAETTTSAPAALPPAPPVPVIEEAPKPQPKVVRKKTVKKPDYAGEGQPNAYAPPSCYDCGVVESIRSIQQQQPTSGVGAGVGAVVGGLLGNQIGAGSGRTLATIAGAVGGGVAGNEIEKRGHTATKYEVIVRMDNGERRRFIMSALRWREGDLVRVEDGNLYAR